MKKLLIFISFILSFCNISAQPYQSIFGSNSTEWVYKYGNEFGTHNDTAFIMKDTTVNSTVYKLLVNSHKYQSRWCLLREDTSTGTVWCKGIKFLGNPDDTLERVISRMNLNVGDTFDISNVRLEKGSYPDSWDIVDSIKMVNGSKQIYMKGVYGIYNEPYTLIEGIGSNMGIFWKYAIYPPHTFTGGYYLLCSYKDGQRTSYNNKYYDGACRIGTDIKNVEKQQEILLYPQPAENTVYIKTKSTNKINKVEIIGYTGITVKVVSHPLITSLDVSDIPAGYYMLKLYTSGGFLTTKPMLIK